MKHLPTFTFALSAFVLVCSSVVIRAQTSYFPNDATINYAVPGDAEIGMDSSFNVSSPTVSLVMGGSINGVADANDASVFNVTGGAIGTGIRAMSFSTVNISGGSINGDVEADKSSTINISGGSISGDLNGDSGGTSHFNFYGVDLAALLFDPSDPSDPDNVLLYHLSGTLLDGTVLSAKNLYVDADDQFTISNTPTAAVPEPGRSALLISMGITGMGLCLRRRKC